MDIDYKFSELFHQYKKDVLNFLMYYLNSVDVDDAFQETFIKAHKAILRNGMPTNTRLWLIAIARNSAIDYEKREKNFKKKAIRFINKQTLQQQLLIDEKFLLDERKKTILIAVYKMKKSYQDVVILRGLKELTVAETADILHWNENKVRITYHRALKKMRNILEEGGANDEWL